MSTATIFANNQSQAVRLPRAVAFPPYVKQVEVQVVGDTRILTPVVDTWRDWALRRRATDPSFLADREQGAYDRRNWDDR